MSTLEAKDLTGDYRLAKPAQWRLKMTFWLDLTLLVSVCALQSVSFTGLVVHEWLGLAMVAMVLAHLLLAWSWISTQSRRLFAAQSIRSRMNYLINLSLFACVTAVIFSGILISQKAIPALIGGERVAGHGLALGQPSQLLLGGPRDSVRVSRGDQLGLDARGHSERVPPLPGRSAVKFIRAISRIVILLLVAAAFVGLTRIYGDSVHPRLPGPRGRAERLHRPAAPQVGRLPEFLGASVLLAYFAVVGRVFLRLRLSPAPRNEGPPISLNLHVGRQDSKA
jgi:hypothetical protein